MEQDKKKSENVESRRDRILSAAEPVFAQFGYDGATVRKIAELADTPVALVNYHFGSKLGLYRAVFERRAPTIVDQRIAGLQMARAEPDLERRVDLVVRALILPMYSLRGANPSADFGRIVTREMSDPQAEARGIFREMFDPIADMLIEAIGECFPDWTKAEVHWAYHTMLGAMTIVLVDNGRIARLSGGACSSDDWEEAARHVCSILAAGLKHRDRSLTRSGKT
ncbi:TetR/AcrR family transcriptional regulator [Oricola sp.]|uniref:TetR/AcrR family transcriptional regulator n=1 Tax=Oricola sp. TaxID=1979950 RepID=UPI0025F0E12D|nr:TetR/AcrR family transcriptional regulator [Oricola sp.]MCI5077122.1 CerR family C-terminal domain-containing protein [Oricola sp.]